MRTSTNFGLCCALTIGWAYPVFAQAPAEEPKTVSAADIIVQARRKDESLQDVPAVVSVVTADMIEKLNIRQFADISAVVPGLSLGMGQTGIGGNASLRGINFDVQASGNNGTVEFYFNDASIQAGAIIQSTFDIGQVEVLRGPQGTLRGRASPSGSITVTPRRSDLYDFGGYAMGTVTDLGGYNINGAANVPIIKEVLGLRVAGVYDENRIDLVRPQGRPGRPISKTEGVRVSLLAQPANDIELQVTYQRLDLSSDRWEQVESLSETDPSALASPVLITARDRFGIADGASISDQTYDTVNWQASFGFSGKKLSYVGSYNRFQSNVFGVGSNAGDSANRFPGIEYGQRVITDSKDWTHELRLQNEERVAGLFDYVMGAFYRKSAPPSDIYSPTFLTAFGNPISPTATTNPVITQIERRGRAIEKSIFANLTAHLGGATELSGGGRYIHYDETKVLSIPAFNATLQDVNQLEDAWIYSASIKHSFSDSLTLYANTASSWRPSIITAGNYDLQRSPLEQSFLQTLPEASTSYEIGLKSAYLDRKILLNVAAYHQKFKNYPYRVPGAGVFFVNTTANAATTPPTLVQGVSAFNFVSGVPVEINGVEADINFRPSGALSLSANLSYSLGKIKNGIVPCNDLNSDGIPDGAISTPTLGSLIAATGQNNISACEVNIRSGFNSPFSGSAQAEYNFPVHEGMVGYVRGLLTYNGNSRGDPTNPNDQVSNYGLLNLYGGLRGNTGNWELTVFVKNVTGTNRVLTRTASPVFTSYRETRPPDAGTQVFTSSYNAITMTAPREFGLSLRVAYGSR